jgi:hypothetical protein
VQRERSVVTQSQYLLLVTSQVGTKQHGLACCTDSMHGKDVLGVINPTDYDCHDFPSQVS